MINLDKNVSKHVRKAVDLLLKNEKRLLNAKAIENYSPISNESEGVVVEGDNEILLDGVIIDSANAEFYEKVYGIKSVVSSKAFGDALAKVDGDNVKLAVNSPGGLVTEGAAIHQHLVNWVKEDKTFDVEVRGLAASAATYTLFNANSVSLGELSSIMIHRTMAGIFAWEYGDRDVIAASVKEGQKVVDLLDKFDTAMTGLYARHTAKVSGGDGLDKKAIYEQMVNEEFLVGQEAVDGHFATELIKVEDDADGGENDDVENKILELPLAEFDVAAPGVLFG